MRFVGHRRRFGYGKFADGVDVGDDDTRDLRMWCCRIGRWRNDDGSLLYLIGRNFAENAFVKRMLWNFVPMKMLMNWK